jgi:uncharacterized protein (DUF952 family)
LTITDLQQEDFIHCSSILYFWRVASNFCDVKQEMVLLCINTDRLDAVVKWEELDKCGCKYPHIYCEINTVSIQMVLSYEKDKMGNWIKNEMFVKYKDK